MLPGSVCIYEPSLLLTGCMKIHHILPAIQIFLLWACFRLYILMILLLLSASNRKQKLRVLIPGNNVHGLPLHLQWWFCIWFRWLNYQLLQRAFLSSLINYGIPVLYGKNCLQINLMIGVCHVGFFRLFFLWAGPTALISILLLHFNGLCQRHTFGKTRCYNMEPGLRPCTSTLTPFYFSASL